MNLVEPLFRGHQHAQFNAALLAAARYAAPAVRLVFLSHPRHRELVEEALRDEGYSDCLPDATDVIAPPPPLRGGRWQRSFSEAGLYLRCLAHGRRDRAHLVVFCSISRAGIAMVKAFGKLLAPRSAILLVSHKLDYLVRDERSRLNCLPFASLLALPQPATLKFAALGGSVLDAVVRQAPRLAGRFVCFEHPYLMPRSPRPATLPSERPVRFGHLGIAHRDRLEVMARLARRLRGCEDLKLVFVGYAPKGADSAEADLEAPRRPLSRAEYRERAAGLHYVVWSGADESGLRASTTFVEAVALAKPLICLANPLVDGYFERFGDIGYRCRDLGELESTMRAVAAELPAQRYERQVAALLSAQEAFSPQRVGRQLGRAFASFGHRGTELVEFDES